MFIIFSNYIKVRIKSLIQSIREVYERQFIIEHYVLIPYMNNVEIFN